MKLDPSKPYATVHGAQDGCAYEQDGRAFNAAGDEMPQAGVMATSKQASELNRQVLHLPKK